MGRDGLCAPLERIFYIYIPPSLPFLLSVSLTLLFWQNADADRLKVAVPPDPLSFLPSANRETARRIVQKRRSTSEHKQFCELSLRLRSFPSGIRDLEIQGRPRP